LSSASATAVNSGSDGLSFARSTAGGSVAGFDTVTTDGCAEGLVLAPPRRGRLSGRVVFCPICGRESKWYFDYRRLCGRVGSCPPPGRGRLSGQYE